jgi:putative hydrolase of the HAD superfamily
MKDSPSFENIKTIFFDLGDTLYSNEAMEAAYPRKLVELLIVSRNLSKDAAKALLKETSEKLQGTVKHVTKVRAMAELGYSREQVHEAFCKVKPSEFLEPDKELDLVLNKLSKKYKLGIISNFKRSHVWEILNALGTSPEWFPLLVTEDIVAEIKPDHEPFLKAIELADCPSQECLYVGDSPTKDMQPAKEVGMLTILVGQDIPDGQARFIDASILSVKQIVDVLATH